ncbi:hypothetical protein [Hyphomicrobium sp. 1Nfss2.1]|uniref:hypothetical protein n=1 Tax=Hyphomicrobium sp. 1Nfss2.1 TaxID=3413936 RepID=UPI003C7CBD80
MTEMFARIFMKGRAPSKSSLSSYFEDVLFDSEGDGADPRSRVFVDREGVVRGFIGVWPRRMMLGGRIIEAAAAGSMMVDRPEDHPTAGARLLRAYLAGPQDLSFSETANGISQRMWERVGGERITAASLDWLKVLRPAGFCVAAAGASFRPFRALRPLGSVIDRLTSSSAGFASLDETETRWARDVPATTGEVLDAIQLLSGSYQLRPDWELPALPRLLAHAESKERYGELHRRIVYGRGDKPVACYLFHARRGDIARVLQVLAEPNAAGLAIDSLLRTAAGLGCVGVRGRAEPGLFDALVSRRCLLYHGAATVIHARDKSLLSEVQGARSLMTGLAGESWLRLIGGSFA